MSRVGTLLMCQQTASPQAICRILGCFITELDSFCEFIRHLFVREGCSFLASRKTFFTFFIGSLLLGSLRLLIGRRLGVSVSGLMTRKRHFLRCSYKLGCDSKLLSQFVRLCFDRGSQKSILRPFLCLLMIIASEESLFVQNELIVIQVLNLPRF